MAVRSGAHEGVKWIPYRGMHDPNKFHSLYLWLKLEHSPTSNRVHL